MLSERLKKLRSEKDLLQKDVATFLKITTSAYGFYEQGKRILDSEMLNKLADFFKVSVDYLLGRTDFQNQNTINELTAKDKKDIQKDLKNIMDDYREQKDGTKYYNGVELQDQDFDYLELAMQVALEKIKVKNKEKYTPKKFKK